MTFAHILDILPEKADIDPENCMVIPLQGGNNRVFRVISGNSSYVLKKYFVSDKDGRDRLAAEFNFSQFLWKNGIRKIAQPFSKNCEKHSGLYQYVEGKRPGRNDVKKDYIIKAMDFIDDINSPALRGAALKPGRVIDMASDFCSCTEQYIDGVEKRIERISQIRVCDDATQALSDFLTAWLVPEWKKIRNNICRSEFFETLISDLHLILSPSDFGFHNCLINGSGQMFFIDFEYAGWDDPVKLICDFFCQPEIPVSMQFFDYCAERIHKIAGTDIAHRAEALMPLFRIKWCCIMLNDFLKSGSQRRRYAFFDEDRRMVQLKKTRMYFNNAFEQV